MISHGCKMRLLALDTCMDACSAAVIDGSGDGVVVRASHFEPMQRGHAERIVAMIADVTSAAGQAYDTFDAIAVTRGPGTFTGVRIGVATARALALATGRPVLATSSLALVAATARANATWALGEVAIVVAVEARKAEIYVAAFRREGAALKEPAVLSPAAAAAAIARVPALVDAIVIGSGAPALCAAAESAGARLHLGPTDILPDAAHIAGTALTAADPLVPLYLRAADAVPPSPATLVMQP